MRNLTCQAKRSGGAVVHYKQGHCCIQQAKIHAELGDTPTTLLLYKPVADGAIASANMDTPLGLVIQSGSGILVLSSSPP